jgi:hypothetical protein
MSEKRAMNCESDALMPRQTCAAWPRLDCLKSNPDRPYQARRYAGYRDATVLDGILHRLSNDLSVGYQRMTLGVGMNGRPNPRSQATSVNFRIAYGARALGQRSFRSSPRTGKPSTWRREAGACDGTSCGGTRDA